MIRPTRTTSRWQDMWGTANPSRTSSGLIRPRPLGGAGGRCFEHPFSMVDHGASAQAAEKESKVAKRVVFSCYRSVCFTASRL